MVVYFIQRKSDGAIKIGYSECLRTRAESGNRKDKIAPDVEWVDGLFFGSRGLPIFMKDNLRPMIGDARGIIQEFPEVMRW